MNITAQVTRYRVDYSDDPRGVLVEQAVEQHLAIDGSPVHWLHLDDGPQSIQVENLYEAIERGGWVAQMGTKPVYVEPCSHPELSHECCGSTCQLPNGGWGGHNYPRIFVSADQLQRVIEMVQNG
jgi:hypothetical protein